ncbi:MAG: MBL fold metallo-hydrolase [Candidatus Delongbacteria bacterium]|jgi:L-ascorbate metabolism protein UlaG (beta-lactamase superfamily)|nr:MBL fold metallo-hydrolase [Candidatus Delongbacteria bacterium]
MLQRRSKLKILLIITVILIITSTFLTCCSSSRFIDSEKNYKSDHFDGEKFFNQEKREHSENDQTRKKRSSWKMFGYWTSGWLFGFDDWPEWPYFTEDSLSLKIQNNNPKPVENAGSGEIIITPVGHSTFLIQLSNINILIDPQWSDRASPVSFKGPVRHHLPGINFDDLPKIDVVLVSHNHYDHLDMSTLEDLTDRGSELAVTGLGNAEMIMDTGFKIVHEFDWWEKIKISDEVDIYVVPSQHFSSRSLWDRNETLWCGFVISYNGEYIYFSGDTGYGKYFKQIKDKFSPIRAAILPISPYRNNDDTFRTGSIHMNPFEITAAHLDLDPEFSIACHYNVFQLGPLSYGQAASDLQKKLLKRDIPKDKFLFPELGVPIILKKNNF